jgi:hypothetical protein
MPPIAAAHHELDGDDGVKSRVICRAWYDVMSRSRSPTTSDPCSGNRLMAVELLEEGEE